MILPAGLYLGIHLAEGETITPMLLARCITLNLLLVIVSLVSGSGGTFLSAIDQIDKLLAPAQPEVCALGALPVSAHGLAAFGQHRT
jgi:hypothetical protein